MTINILRNPKYAVFREQSRLLLILAGAFLLAVLVPEISVFSWTPVRGDSPQPESEVLKTAAAKGFATPWVVPDPPPLRAAPAQPLVSFPPSSPGAAKLSIKASNISWVTVCADGRKVMERLFEAGTSAEIPFSRQAVMRTGNAAALEVNVAGQPVGSLGPWGAIRTIKATPEGYRFVEPVVTSSCDGV